MTNTPFPLELQNISCAFGEGPRHVSALNNVSLAVNPGELVAIMGPSGSGKSTLLNVAGLLQRATSGHVLIDGASASDLNAKRAAETRRRHIGVIFQNYNLIPTLTVGENVGLPLELDGIIDREAVAIALREVGLEGFDNRFPEEISGGQAQRVAIARALIGPRKILLADEPTGALDTSTGDAVLRVLRQRVDSGAAGLLVTHEPRFAA